MWWLVAGAGAIGLAADGVVYAKTLNVRTTAADDELARIRLTVEITDLVDGPSFLVRGVPVDASGVTPSSPEWCAMSARGLEGGRGIGSAGRPVRRTSRSPGWRTSSACADEKALVQRRSMRTAPAGDEAWRVSTSEPRASTLIQPSPSSARTWDCVLPFPQAGVRHDIAL